MSKRGRNEDFKMEIQRPIDNFGRIVLPKDMRQALGMTEKTALEITVKDGCFVLKPVDGVTIERHTSKVLAIRRFPERG